MMYYVNTKIALRMILGVVFLFSGALTLHAAEKVSAKRSGKEIQVMVDGHLFTSYKFDDSQKYPYFWPVNGPKSGKSVTTESSKPWPHHHSLFFGCDHVNDGNYWQDANARGQILSEGPNIIESSGDRVEFTDECFWKKPDHAPIIRDIRRVLITAPDQNSRVIDFEITLQPLTDIRITKTNHSLFSARVVPELSADSGGTLINAEGKTREKGTWGIHSEWIDYSGTWDNGTTEGIAIFQNPNNRWFPSRWFTRDYGFFSPTPMYWPPNGKYIDFQEGEIITLKYRVVVHEGDNEAAHINDLFREYRLNNE